MNSRQEFAFFHLQEGNLKTGEAVPADGIHYALSWKTLVFASDLNEVGTLAAVTKQKGATSIFGYKPFPAGGTKQELEFKYEHLGIIKKLAMGFLQL